MSEPARDDAEPDLTAEERAELRRLLRLIRRGAGLVDDAKAAKVRPQARDEDFAEVARIRRRKGLTSG